MSTEADPVEVVRFLIAQGVKPLQWTCEGHSALHFAVSNGHLESAKALIDAGESLFARNEIYAQGMTIEQTRKLMGRGLAAMDKMMAEMAANWEEGDDDLPPPPDTSLPEGEKAAEMLDLIAQAQQNMGGMMDQLRQKAQQQQDEGMRGEPANAQRWYRHPAEAERILPILEAYERERRGG
jgi:ankyrin repeat protein